jgi:hypothetical protein
MWPLDDSVSFAWCFVPVACAGAAERFRIRVLHAHKQKKNESEKHNLPNAWNDRMARPLNLWWHGGLDREQLSRGS